MIRALPAPLAIQWRTIAFTAYVTINLYFIATWMVWEPYTADLAIWEALPAALRNGTLYDLGTEIAFVWSPVIAPVQAMVAIIGFWPQAVLHLAFVALLRDWRLIVLVLSSFMFWPAILGANPLFTLIVVAAMLAWRGSDRWAVIFLALALMIPRPLQVPLVVCLLVVRPTLRVPFAVLFVAHALAVLASGYAMPWMEAMIEQARRPVLDIGPRIFVTPYWLVLAVPLGLLLTYLKRPGWAGLLLSPYWLGGYWLWPLIELVPQQRTHDADEALDRSLRLRGGGRERAVVAQPAEGRQQRFPYPTK